MRSTACTGDGASRGDDGATLVEFLGVALLTIVALLGIAQFALWTWARDVAVNAAHEGARTAAEAGRPLDDGVARTRTLLRDGLGSSGSGFEVRAAQRGGDVEVMARGDAPSVVPFLPRFSITTSAHAFDEDAVIP